MVLQGLKKIGFRQRLEALAHSRISGIPIAAAFGQNLDVKDPVKD